MNLIDYSVEYDNEFTKEFIGYYKNNGICIARCQLVDNCIEFALYGTSCFVQYNLITRQIAVTNVLVDNLCLSYKKKNGSVVFLTNDTSQVYVKEKDGTVANYLMNENEKGNRYYNGVAEYNGTTYIFPAFSNRFLFLKAKDSYKTFSMKIADDEVLNPLLPKFYGAVLTDFGICLLPFHSKHLYIVADESVSKVAIEEDYSIEKMHVDDIRLFDENKLFGLNTYIKALTNS